MVSTRDRGTMIFDFSSVDISRFEWINGYSPHRNLRGLQEE